MKSYIYIFLIPMFLTGILGSSLSAQTVRHAKVNFQIESMRLFNDTIFASWNDTMLVMKLNFREDPSSVSSSSLSGSIVLSMCGCYCDSLWDAWPSGVGGGGISGYGTLSYLASTSSTGGGVFNPANLVQGGLIRNRGMLGIQSVTGGIVRNTEFVVPVTFQLE